MVPANAGFGITDTVFFALHQAHLVRGTFRSTPPLWVNPGRHVKQRACWPGPLSGELPEIPTGKPGTPEGVRLVSQLGGGVRLPF
jgi:hypothetical protein